MNKKIIWVHGDCLDPNQKALVAHPNCPAIWVWDDKLLHRRGLSLKRITFIYECLLELPVDIRRGQTVKEITHFAREHQVSTVVTTHSVSPGFSRIFADLQNSNLEVITYALDPFVDLSSEPDLRRFSRYWRGVQKQLRSESV